MKILKIKSNYLLIALVALFACESNDLGEAFISSEMEEIENPNVLTEAETIEETNRFLSLFVLKGDESATLRSLQMKPIECAVLSQQVKVSLKDTANLRRAYQVVPVHTIKYKDNEGRPVGYAITIADRRFENRIIAFSKEGEADLLAGDEAGFRKEWLEGYIHDVVNREASAGVQLRSSGKDVFYYHRLNFRYNWQQSGIPFTDYTPFRNGIRAAAGCNAVAMGMIMAWHQWPLQGGYPRYEKTPGGVIVLKHQYPAYKKETWMLFHPYRLIDEVSPTDPDVREHIADLFAEIGYKMNTDYKSDSSADTYPDFACSVFPRMGYHCNPKLETFDATAVFNDINMKRPVFMAGLRQGGAGHSYVVTGVITRGEYTGNISVDTCEPEYIYLMNGNAGKGDGWYSVSLFSSNTDTLDDDEATGIVYSYRYKCKILTNIRPDFDNAGSTEIWRVSGVRPY